MGREEKMGFGVVGVNPRIRRAVITGIAGSRRARLAAVCSRDPEKATSVAAEHDCAPYTSYEAMLRDPAVETVFICTPHDLHCPMALQALAAGKRVVCEKPLSVGVEEAERMAAAARAVDYPSLVNFTYHSLPGQRLVARLLEDGEIGRIIHLDLTYWQAREALPGAKKDDALLDVGSHVLDLALWWLEVGGAGPVRSIVAQEDRRAVKGRPEPWRPIFAVMGETDGGARFSLQANRVAAGWRNAMSARLVGEAGTITLTFDTDFVEVQVARFGDGVPEGTFRPRPIPEGIAVGYAAFPGVHVDRITAALLGEEAFPNFEHGLRVQRLMDAVRRSAEDRSWVKMDL